MHVKQWKQNDRTRQTTDENDFYYRKIKTENLYKNQMEKSEYFISQEP
ncbi:uncharacterized protein METZ01_LOCUS179474 [marine metagenome]|uniref:Uncharacterized protein n=1 Tax=marine metagenome TaxID=408172 RepID=A0A382CKL4_9ZZZZ